jgi:hypothetical protein
MLMTTEHKNDESNPPQNCVHKQRTVPSSDGRINGVCPARSFGEGHPTLQKLAHRRFADMNEARQRLRSSLVRKSSAIEIRLLPQYASNMARLGYPMNATDYTAIWRIVDRTRHFH